MIIKPLGEYVLLEVKEYANPKSGLVLPPHLRKKKPIGTVVDYSDMCKDEFRKGDVVIFDKSGTKKVGEYLVLCPTFRINLKEI